MIIKTNIRLFGLFLSIFLLLNKHTVCQTSPNQFNKSNYQSYLRIGGIDVLYKLEGKFYDNDSLTYLPDLPPVNADEIKRVIYFKKTGDSILFKRYIPDSLLDRNKIYNKLVIITTKQQ